MGLPRHFSVVRGNPEVVIDTHVPLNVTWMSRTAASYHFPDGPFPRFCGGRSQPGLGHAGVPLVSVGLHCVRHNFGPAHGSYAIGGQGRHHAISVVPRVSSPLRPRGGCATRLDFKALAGLMY